MWQNILVRPATAAAGRGARSPRHEIIKKPPQGAAPCQKKGRIRIKKRPFLTMLCALVICLGLLPIEIMAEKGWPPPAGLSFPATHYQRWQKEDNFDRWETTLEGWAAGVHMDTTNLLYPETIRPDIWIDSGRNEAGRDNIAKQYLIRTTYWKLTEDGLLDMENRQMEAGYFEGYNVGIEREKATLYLQEAYISDTTANANCITFYGDASGVIDSGIDTFTIVLTGENRIAPERNFTNKGAIICEDLSNDGSYMSILLTGDGWLDITSNPNQESLASNNYGICVENSSLAIETEVSIHMLPFKRYGTGQEIVAVKTGDGVDIRDGAALLIELADGTQSCAFDGPVTVESGGTLEVSVGVLLRPVPGRLHSAADGGKRRHAEAGGGKRRPGGPVPVGSVGQQPVPGHLCGGRPSDPAGIDVPVEPEIQRERQRDAGR